MTKHIGSLTPGTRLGVYEVTAKIGEGGMGEVWQARDTKLDRDVALKVLPEAFTSDPDRLARFEREAKVLASLNHPNIGSIYGLEEAEGVKALVLELVEGPTLADRIAKGPIPLDEALPIAKQIAEALEAAHEAGVIHRDLKPANIKVREDGTVKVLDFGLAKVLAGDVPNADLSQSPTVTAAGTQQGVILGTAAYMSPEQARGKVLDKRTDIWAFGCVLFEMLTGRAAFGGETLSDTIGRVMERKPQWETLPARTSLAIRTLLRRCLTKDPRQRLRDMGDARFEIDLQVRDPCEAASAPDVVRVSSRLYRSAAIALVGALVVVILAGAFSGWRMRPPPAARPIEFSIIPTPEAPLGQLVSWDGPEVGIAFSPDGHEIVYVADRSGTSQLYRRPLDEAEATPIPGTEGAEKPSFSPDGQWLAYVDRDEQTLRKVRSIGGVAVELGEATGWGSLSWGPGGTIVASAAQGMHPGLWTLRDIPGVSPELLVAPDPARGESAYRRPHHLPGGEAVLFTIVRAGRTIDESQIGVVNAETGEKKIVHQEGFNPRYSPTGHLLYGLGGTIRAVPFDLDRLEVTGEPSLVVDGVATTSLGSAKFDVSSDGTLVYVPGPALYEGGRMVWVDRAATLSLCHSKAPSLTSHACR